MNNKQFREWLKQFPDDAEIEVLNCYTFGTQGNIGFTHTTFDAEDDEWRFDEKNVLEIGKID